MLSPAAQLLVFEGVEKEERLVAITEYRDRTAVFGCALLQGEVLPCIIVLSRSENTEPSLVSM